MDEKTRKLIEDKEREITSLRTALTAEVSEYGDYRIIKTYEARLKGEPDTYNIEPIIAKREEMRLRINELEAEIADLRGEPLPPDEKDTKAFALAQLDSGYDRAKQQLRDLYVEALMQDDADTQAELKTTLGELNAQYDADRAAIEGGN